MRKVYKQPTIKVMKLHPRTTMLTGSEWPEGYTSTISEEEGKQGDYN